MRVLVTGASGFIGRFFLPVLAQRGHEVCTGSRHAEHTLRAMEGCQALVHLANIAHTRASREELWHVNVEGTQRVAEEARSRGVKRFVYLSSIKASAAETRGEALDGSEVPRPGDDYGQSKLAAERMLLKIAERTGLEVVILRPPLVYGPGVKANFLLLMRAIASGWPLPLGGLRNRRSLLYVGNLADAVVACLERPVQSRPYPLADGAAVSTTQLCAAAARALEVEPRLFSLPIALLARLPRLRALVGDLEVDDHAFREDLHWAPPYGMEEGLRATAQWYRAR